jgi:hypothetical protein
MTQHAGQYSPPGGKERAAEPATFVSRDTGLGLRFAISRTAQISGVTLFSTPSRALP